MHPHHRVARVLAARPPRSRRDGRRRDPRRRPQRRFDHPGVLRPDGLRRLPRPGRRHGEVRDRGPSRCAGVATVRTRTTATLAVWLGGDQTKVQGTLIGVPDQSPGHRRARRHRRPAARPESANDAVVERHSADDLGISPGDPLRILGLGDIVDVNVRGIAVSPEYLLPAASQQQIVTARGQLRRRLRARDAGRADRGRWRACPRCSCATEPAPTRAAVDARLARVATTRPAPRSRTHRRTSRRTRSSSEERAGFDDAGDRPARRSSCSPARSSSRSSPGRRRGPRSVADGDDDRRARLRMRWPVPSSIGVAVGPARGLARARACS